MADNEGYILLVEDNPDDEALTIRALQKNNIETDVVVARDGMEALDVLYGRWQADDSISEVPPMLVLLDLNLPKMCGLEVLKRIREDHRTAMQPVVILTTSVEDQDIVNSYSLGANSYIRKPVDFSQFVDVVRELGVYWLTLNVAPPQRH